MAPEIYVNLLTSVLNVLAHYDERKLRLEFCPVECIEVNPDAKKAPPLTN